MPRRPRVTSVSTGTYPGGRTRVLGIDIPAGITVNVDVDISTRMSDAVFYPQGYLLSASVDGTPIEVCVYRDGEARVLLNSGSPREQILKDPDDFARAFPGGDADLHEDRAEIEWQYNPWFDLYMSPLAEDGYTEHLDRVHHTIADAISEAIGEAALWLPWTYLFHEDTPTSEFLNAAMSGNEFARQALEASPYTPDEALIAAHLSR